MTDTQATKIERHGRNLLAIFPNAAEQDPVKLCKKLRRLERKAASATEIKNDVDAVLRKHLDKNDVDAVAAIYNGPDVQNLPPGKTAWRLSNAVSFFAQAENLSADRKLELQAVAGRLIPHKEAEALAV